MPVVNDLPVGPAPSGCLLEWLRRNGLWSVTDDAVVIARYGPTAFDGHQWCCVKRLWER